MKILYDYRIFDDQIFGGISNSFVQLISHLPADVDYEIAVAESNNVHLRNSGLMDIPPPRAFHPSQKEESEIPTIAL